jgi:predicted lipid-binding transport protein (Tim44 family)
MKRFAVPVLAALVACLLLAGADADAKRLGGGKSLGTQRQSIAPPSSTPAPSATVPGGATNPVMPAQPGMAAAKAATPAAASGASRWLGPIAGLAAGLGLAALMSHLGLSEAFGSFLLLALLGVAAVFLVRMFLVRRGAPAGSPLRYAPAGGTVDKQPDTTPDPVRPASSAFTPVFGGATPSAGGKFPPGFDADGFAAQAKLQFARLQAAYDSNDRAAMADVMTPAMLAEVARDIDARGPHTATVVEALAAEVLEVTTERDHHWASVHFTGRTREDGSPAQPFDEVWNLSKPVDGSSGWLLAGIQQLAAA